MGNLVDLTKKAGVVLEKKQLTGVQANIVLAMDKSGSMGGRFRNGIVQEIVDRLLAIGLNMDTDKSIDVYTFNSDSQYIGQANERNHRNFVENKRIYADGGTRYGPVMRDIIRKYGKPSGRQVITRQVEKKGFLGKLLGLTETVEEVVEHTQEAAQVPTFVFFITDGDNYDQSETTALIREASRQGIFWQFVGIGNDDLDFLEHLDEMSGRYIDNANFFDANDIMSISDEVLYDRLLNEFPIWLKEAKAKGVLA